MNIPLKNIFFLIILICLADKSFGQYSKNSSLYYEMPEKNDYVKVIKVTDGVHDYYDENKKIASSGKFKKGRLIKGEIYFYNDQEILTRIAVYNDGKYVGDIPLEEPPNIRKDSSLVK